MSEIAELRRQVTELERQVAILTVKIDNILAQNRQTPAYGRWVTEFQQGYDDFQRRFPPVTLTDNISGVR